jgi:2-polyprenyl-3-methyl-5-hydroxy-6-metoxy-1,4-benzoquinol methylase
MVTEHAQRYWKYEYAVMARYLVPLLGKWGVTLHGASVLDVGCGEGGGLCAVRDTGARCDGFDLDEQRVAFARSLDQTRSIRFRTGDIHDATPPFQGEEYDLVMLHDVFEHLEDKEFVLRRLATYLTPPGKIFITFPPYYSAFGAHQQNLTTWWARLPFIHLFPTVMTRGFPSLTEEQDLFLSEARRLGRLKMGMRAFEGITRRCDMTILRKKAYLISPNHIRFGLRPLAAGPLAAVPLIGEVACTAVAYLLTPSHSATTPDRNG